MNSLIKNIEALTAVANNIANQNFFNEIKELQLKVKQEKLHLVIVGLFKRGKSSLINALIGKNLAPVAVTPVTSVITYFEYNNDENYALINFKNGCIKKTTIDTVNEYVNEEKNKENNKQVETVAIYNNAPILKIITIVDTPGIGSAFIHNTATTLHYITKIDAALFLVSADMPISEKELDFLKELFKTVPKIIFVINKKDLVSNEDLTKLIQHNITLIATELNLPEQEINFIAVSVKEYQQKKDNNGINILVEKINSIAQQETNKILDKMITNKYNWLYQELLVQIKLKQETLKMPLNELLQKKLEIDKSITIIQTQQQEFESIIQQNIKKLQQQIKEAVNKKFKKLQTEIYTVLETENNITKNDVFIKTQQQINENIIQQFHFLKTHLEELAKEEFKILLKNYSNRSETFFSELTKHLQSLQGINLGTLFNSFNLNAYTSFYLTTNSSLSNLLLSNNKLSYILPATFRKKIIINNLKKHYHEILTQNSASIGYDLEYKIQESFRSFNYDLNKHLNELLKRLQQILLNTTTKKQTAQQLIDAEIRELENKLQIMATIKI